MGRGIAESRIARNLKWQVVCGSDDAEPNDRAYFALARHKEEPSGASYAEDGELPAWTAYGDTQEHAGRNLLAELSGPENLQPSHRPQKTERRQCKRVTGGYGSDDYAVDDMDMINK